MKFAPLRLFRARRGRNVYPRNVKRDVLELISPIAVLAVDNSGLVRVKLQPDLHHSLADRVPQHFRLLLADAVHHPVIHIPLERDVRKRPGHPHVERVVEEEVSQARAIPLNLMNSAGLCAALACLALVTATLGAGHCA